MKISGLHTFQFENYLKSLIIMIIFYKGKLSTLILTYSVKDWGAVRHLTSEFSAIYFSLFIQ